MFAHPNSAFRHWHGHRGALYTSFMCSHQAGLLVWSNLKLPSCHFHPAPGAGRLHGVTGRHSRVSYPGWVNRFLEELFYKIKDILDIWIPMLNTACGLWETGLSSLPFRTHIPSATQSSQQEKVPQVFPVNIHGESDCCLFKSCTEGGSSFCEASGAVGGGKHVCCSELLIEKLLMLPAHALGLVSTGWVPVLVANITPCWQG